MRFFVDISKSQKKESKNKICGEDIIAVYSTNTQPGKDFAEKDNANRVSCRGKEKGLSVIATVQGIYYVSALSVEEVYQRIIKAEADAMQIYQKRIERNDEKLTKKQNKNNNKNKNK